MKLLILALLAISAGARVLDMPAEALQPQRSVKASVFAVKITSAEGLRTYTPLM